MKQIKKLIAITVAIALLLGAVAMAVTTGSANTGFTVSFKADTEVYAGETVAVAIDVQGASNVEAMSFTFNYAAGLVPDSVMTAALGAKVFNATPGAACPSGADTTIKDNGDGTGQVLFVMGLGGGITTDGTFVTLNFTIPSNAAPGTTYVLSINNDFDNVDGNGEPVTTVAGANLTLTVTGADYEGRGYHIDIDTGEEIAARDYYFGPSGTTFYAKHIEYYEYIGYREKGSEQILYSDYAPVGKNGYHKVEFLYQNIDWWSCECDENCQGDCWEWGCYCDCCDYPLCDCCDPNNIWECLFNGCNCSYDCCNYEDAAFGLHVDINDVDEEVMAIDKFYGEGSTTFYTKDFEGYEYVGYMGIYWWDDDIDENMEDEFDDSIKNDMNTIKDDDLESV